MAITVTHDTTRYTLTVTAPAGERFVVDDRDHQVAVETITFDVTTDGGRRLRDVGVHFHAHGHALRADGTPTRAKRTVQGGNLHRIPTEARRALQQGIRDTIGELDDPLGQLNGYDGRR